MGKKSRRPARQQKKLRELCAQAHLANNNDFEAIQEARRAVRLRPNWSEARLTLGRAHYNAGELALAIKDFREAQAC